MKRYSNYAVKKTINHINERYLTAKEMEQEWKILVKKLSADYDPSMAKRAATFIVKSITWPDIRGELVNIIEARKGTAYTTDYNDLDNDNTLLLISLRMLERYELWSNARIQQLIDIVDAHIE